MTTLSGLTVQEVETLSSKAIAAKANAYCMFHNKHHSSITWGISFLYHLCMGTSFEFVQALIPNSALAHVFSLRLASILLVPMSKMSHILLGPVRKG
jgi:hypothetical protein